MAEERVQRRLAAILAADVVGYSLLTRADESGTRTRYNAHLKELIEPRIAEHQGRIVKSTGDGFLAEFSSVVDAVQCAADIQRAMPGRNAGVPAEQRIEFRIGVNLGDVIVEGDDIHGDGVNVASRLEGLAEPNGVCISGAVFEQVKDRMTVGFEDLGPQQVKNIPEPIHAYRVLFDPVQAGQVIVRGVKRTHWLWPAVAASLLVLVGGGIAWWQPWVTRVEAASVARMAHPLPDVPSIAVLPFVNLSGDKEQEFFADGITEDIITDLSKLPGLFVVSRNSTFTYKGKVVKARQVAEELGVRYVLEGSVRKAGENVRITAQLIDAVKGRHAWAERYDRKFKDLFTVGDDVTRNVVGELAVALKARDHERLYRRHTKSLDAYQAFLRAKHLRGFDRESRRRKEKAFQRVVELDPEFAGGYAGLSLAYRQFATHAGGPARKANIERAYKFGQQAMAKDDTFIWSYLALGGAYYAKREFDKAVITMRRAVDLQPSDADAWSFLGFYLHWSGHGDEAIAAIKTSQRLDPSPRSTRNVIFLSMAYSTAGKYKKVIETVLPRYAFFARRGRPAMGYLAAAYAAIGDDEKARATMKEYLAKKPKYRISNYPMLKNYRKTEDRDRFANLLRKAGMPE